MLDPGLSSHSWEARVDFLFFSFLLLFSHTPLCTRKKSNTPCCAIHLAINIGSLEGRILLGSYLFYKPDGYPLATEIYTCTYVEMQKKGVFIRCTSWWSGWKKLLRFTFCGECSDHDVCGGECFFFLETETLSLYILFGAIVMWGKYRSRELRYNFLLYFHDICIYQHFARLWWDYKTVAKFSLRGTKIFLNST